MKTVPPVKMTDPIFRTTLVQFRNIVEGKEPIPRIRHTRSGRLNKASARNRELRKLVKV